MKKPTWLLVMCEDILKQLDGLGIGDPEKEIDTKTIVNALVQMSSDIRWGFVKMIEGKEY